MGLYSIRVVKKLPYCVIMQCPKLVYRNIVFFAGWPNRKMHGGVQANSGSCAETRFRLMRSMCVGVLTTLTKKNGFILWRNHKISAFPVIPRTRLITVRVISWGHFIGYMLVNWIQPMPHALRMPNLRPVCARDWSVTAINISSPSLPLGSLSRLRLL